MNEVEEQKHSHDMRGKTLHRHDVTEMVEAGVRTAEHTGWQQERIIERENILHTNIVHKN